MREWAGDLTEKVTPYLDSIRDLSALSESVPRVVLVVDDDVFQCRLIAQILQGQEFEVVLATSGRGALTLSQRKRPSLFIIDTNMPDIDGIEVTRRLRSMPGSADSPIILITGQSERDVVLKGRAAGATDFIVKPFTKEVLLRKIRSLC